MKKIILIILGILVLTTSITYAQFIQRPVQGGTGIGSATAGDVSKCLTVSDDSPFTYTLGTCGSGSGGAYPFTPTLNYNTLNQATTGIVWFQNGLNASSTSNFADISIGSLVVPNTLLYWNGTKVVATSTNPLYVDRITATSTTASILPYASTTALTSSGSAYFATSGGNVGIATTTPQWLLNPFSTTASQLSLSNGAGIAQWAFRNAGGTLYLATTTVLGTATTTTAALEIAGSGFGTTTLRGLNINGEATSTSNVGMNLTGGCFAISGSCISGSSTAGSGSAYPFTPTLNYAVLNQATTGIAWFQNGLNASSTSHFVYASSTMITTNNIDTISTTATSTFKSPTLFNNAVGQYLLGLIPGGDIGSGSAPVRNGALIIDNTLNTLTPGLYVNSSQDGVPSNPLVIFRSDQDGYNQGLLWLLEASDNTGGAAYGLRTTGANPDHEFDESDQTSPAGDYEIDVNNDALRFNGRNLANTSFESIALFTRKAQNGQDDGGATFCMGCGFSGQGDSTFNLIGTTTQRMPRFTVSNASTSASTGDQFTVLGNGFTGIGTTTPRWKLSVVGAGSFDDYVRASYFKATSSTASQLPYASTTALSIGGFGIATSTTVCKVGNQCAYYTIQEAIDAGYTFIHVRPGVYSEQITVASAKTVIEGEGTNTIIQCNGATQSPCVTSNAKDEFTIRDLAIRELNAQLVGVALDLSNGSLFNVNRIRVSNFSTSTLVHDTANNSFYGRISDSTFFDTKVCVDLSGTLPNDNQISNNRCRPMAVTNSFGFFIQDAEGLTLSGNNVEATTTTNGPTGVFIDGDSVGNTIVGQYCEAAALCVRVDAGALNNTFLGGRFVSSAAYVTDNGTNTVFINTDLTGDRQTLLKRATSTAFGVTGIITQTGSGTSTFVGGIQTPNIHLTSVTATSTALNGIDLRGGCFSVNGVCVGSGGAGSGTVTSVATGDGLTGGPITTTGTVSVNETNLVIGSLVTWDGTNFVATGTPKLTLGNFEATSTAATSTIVGGLTVDGTTLVVDYSGSKVGILTATAYDSLHIGSGQLAITAGAATNNEKLIKIYNSTLSERMSLGYAATDVGLNINNRTGAGLVFFRENGSSGFGTSTPWGRLAASSTSTTLPALTAEQISTGPSAIFLGGKVGIGTTSPYASLSVVGASGVVANHYTATNTLATSTFANSVYAGTTTPGSTGVSFVTKSFNCPEYVVSTSTSMTINPADGCIQLIRLGSSNVTITLPSTGVLIGQTMTLNIFNPNTTAGTITWAGAISWSGGIQPGQTTTANQGDAWCFQLTGASSTPKWRNCGLMSGYQ